MWWWTRTSWVWLPTIVALLLLGLALWWDRSRQARRGRRGRWVGLHRRPSWWARARPRPDLREVLRAAAPDDRVTVELPRLRNRADWAGAT